MRTTATMMFGVGENMEHRVNHFEVVRQLQEETGGFTAFIPWSFQPNNTALGGRGWDEATSSGISQDPRHLAACTSTTSRTFRASWVTQGLKVLQMGLRFGGNDVGSVMLEENVVKRRRHLATAPPKKNCAASSATPASNPSSATRFTQPYF